MAKTSIWKNRAKYGATVKPFHLREIFILTRNGPVLGIGTKLKIKGLKITANIVFDKNHTKYGATVKSFHSSETLFLPTMGQF